MAVGLSFSTSVATGPTNAVGDPNARTFVAGITLKGPVGEATRVTSLTTFVTIFGAEQSYSAALYDFVQTYFAEGGAELYVSRVVGPASAHGTLALMDRAGTPLLTATVNSQDPGGFSSEITIETVAGAVSGVTLNVYDSGVLVEQFANEPTTAQLVLDINTKSNFITAIDAHSVSSGTTSLPAIHAQQPLAGGADDRASITSTIQGNAYAVFGSDLGPGAVAAPGYTGDQVATALIAHCQTNGRIAILTGAQGASQSDLRAIVTGVQSASPLAGDYVGVFGPWVLIPNGSSTKAVDPSGYVCGVRARAINTNGFQKSPAGTISNARFVVGLATPLDASTNNSYNANQINGITVYRGNTRLYGWRSCSLDTVNFFDLTGRSMLNAVQDLVQQAADPYVFDTIDASGVLQGQIQGAIVGYLDEAQKNNAFYALIDPSDGSQTDPGYSVQVNTSSDVIAQYGQNTLVATVGIRPSPTADLILCNIVLAGLGVAV